MNVQEILFTAMPALVGTLLIYLLAQLAKYIQARVKSESLRAFLMLANTASRDAVMELQQTVVDEIKKASPGGISKEESAEIAKKALEVLKRNLGKAGMALGTKALGLATEGLDAYLMGKNEATLAELKLPLK